MGSCFRKPIFEIAKVLDLFLNNNTITELTAEFFPDGNRELWRKTREVTMNFCGIKTIAEDTFKHLTKLQGKVNDSFAYAYIWYSPVVEGSPESGPLWTYVSTAPGTAPGNLESPIHE